jgi:hypothetical protein
VIQFSPGLSEVFLMFAIFALVSCGEALGDEEMAFDHWLSIHKPEFLKPEGRKLLAERVSAQQMAEVRNMRRPEFLEYYVKARLYLARQRRC